MVSFELATPARIVFGAGRAAEAPEAVAALGVRRALLVTGRSAERAAPLAAGLAARGVATVPLRVEGEPTVGLVRDATASAREGRCDGVVALGGGSALDAGKAVAALAATGADPLEHLEVVGRGRPIAGPTLPFVAIPTTAGTGSEVTRNAVLGAVEAGVKASLRSPLMLARLAVVDPDLLAGVPPQVLAASGLDALSQLVEPWLSARANPVTDALAREGIRRSARSLRRAFEQGADAAARDDLAMASLLGGLCLANAGLGAVHGFAAPAGAMLGAPHGAVCAALLVACLEVNHRALRQRAADPAAAERFAELARWVTGSPAASVEDGLAWFRDLTRALGVRGLAAWGLERAQIPALVQRARAASSMRANPVALTDGELAEIAERAL